MSRKETIELEWFTLKEKPPEYNRTIIVDDLHYGGYIICCRSKGKSVDYYESIDGSNDDFSFEEWAYYPF